MFHLGFWLSLLAFPVVRALVTTCPLRATILSNCDVIYKYTSSPLCQDHAFIKACTNFFVMAEICRWTRCNYKPLYPDFALKEVVERRDIAGYEHLVHFCRLSTGPLCRFARTILTVARQCNSVSVCPHTAVSRCVKKALCKHGHRLPGNSCPIHGTVCCKTPPKTTITTTTKTSTTTRTTPTTSTTAPTTSTTSTTTPTTTSTTTTTPTTTSTTATTTPTTSTTTPTTTSTTSTTTPTTTSTTSTTTPTTTSTTTTTPTTSTTTPTTTSTTSTTTPTTTSTTSTTTPTTTSTTTTTPTTSTTTTPTTTIPTRTRDASFSCVLENVVRCLPTIFCPLQRLLPLATCPAGQTCCFTLNTG